VENEFKTPDYYNQSKPKTEEKLTKRKCFACGKEKEMGKFERYCCDSCRSRATRYYQTPSSIIW
jgi:Zn finger protein HypA/HybF involved in hydrogenase expression